MDGLVGRITSIMQKARYFLVLGIPLLALTVLFSWMGARAPSESAAKSQDTPDPGNKPGGGSLAESPPDPRPAVRRDVPAVADAAEISFDVRAVSKTQPDPGTGFELRSERRELSAAVRDLYRGDSPPPESLRFPLFDGRFIRLSALRHQSMGADQGVVFAKADGEVEGGHVLLSYVGTALAGMIHLPSRGEFYEIRTGPDGRSHILTQLDPHKMGACGECQQHVTK
jgi:hypothetical protein